jgi:hypothetical protein
MHFLFRLLKCLNTIYPLSISHGHENDTEIVLKYIFVKYCNIYLIIIEYVIKLPLLD